jgi:hypothetical protein
MAAKKKKWFCIGAGLRMIKAYNKIYNYVPNKLTNTFDDTIKNI